MLLPDALCGVFCQLGNLLAMTLGGSDYLHLLPVVCEFFSAIEADNIGSGQGSSLGAARCATDGYRKAIAIVPAAEDCIY